jgi:hypothetical protein
MVTNRRHPPGGVGSHAAGTRGGGFVMEQLFTGPRRVNGTARLSDFRREHPGRSATSRRQTWAACSSAARSGPGCRESATFRGCA